MKKEITIGELNKIYEKYGDLKLKVKNPYGYHDITWCGITEENADVYRCELDNGMFVEGADYHRLKKSDGEFTTLNVLKEGELIQTIYGNIPVKSCSLLEEKDTLYDIQVDEVHQYYTNGIVSHNTTFTIDALLFLFFGVTTKTDRNEDIFNKFSDKNELSVRGIVEIESNDFIIERLMSRSAKRDGTGYTIKNTVNYYEILPDGEEKLLDGKDAIETTKKIVDTIGTESDFMTTILATGDNLTDLIETQSTARGKLLNRFIGLEIIEEKEQAARTMYNTFAKTMKSNQYSIINLSGEIDDHNETIKDIEGILLDNEEKVTKIREELIILNENKEDTLRNKQIIDSDIVQLDPIKIQKNIDDIIKNGKLESDNSDVYKKRLVEIGNVSFDEILYENTLTRQRDVKLDKETNEREIIRLEKLNSELKDSEVCTMCKRPLEGIDHTDHIIDNVGKIELLQRDIIKYEKTLLEIEKKILILKSNKDLTDEKDKLELKKDRCEVVISSLRNELKSKKNDLTRYNLNNSAIELNRKLDVEISGINGKIQRNEGDRDILLGKIQKCKSDIEQNKTDITNKNTIIETIKKEDQVEKIYKIYIDMVGKRGISKLVLRSVIPIINFELHRLLDEVVDFDVELEINSKNDLDFMIVKDNVRNFLKSGSGFEKTASALALRCVLARISNLPKPNFIGFDEIFGKVADENLDYMRDLFEKIKDMFDIVLLITHNTIIRDWASHIITIKKENNISTISAQ
jgi:DNA repair exonuclease SbcCD ATPase subunit